MPNNDIHTEILILQFTAKVQVKIHEKRGTFTKITESEELQNAFNKLCIDF